MHLQLPFNYSILGPTHQADFTHQQAIGGVDGEAAREGVVDGESVHVCRLPVASALVYIPAYVKVERVPASQALLAHVLQLHVRQMD